MNRLKWAWRFLLPMLGLLIAPRVYNEVHPYASFALVAACVYFLINNSLKQIQK